MSLLRSSPLSRPLVSRWAVGAWLVLLATLPLGLKSYRGNSRIGLFVWDPGSKMGINYRAYHHAAELALDGKVFYDVAPPDTFDWAVYLYPPVTVIFYYPFTLLEWTTGYAILTVLSVLAAVAATALIVDYVESFGPTLGWVDIALVLAAFLLSTHAFGTIYFGNINMFLALAFVLGFWALHQGRQELAGVIIGLTALFKVFPAIIGLWFLRQRQWRAVGAAIATGIGGLLAGLALFGFDTTKYYFTDVLTGRAGSDQFVGGYPVDGTYYVTIQQPLSHYLWELWPSAPYEAVVVLAILVCIPVLAYFYRDVTTDVDRLMAIFVTLVVMLVVFTSFRWYLIFLYLPLVALLYIWREGPGRILFIAGGLIFSVTESTEGMVELLNGLPEPLDTLWYSVASAAVPPLYGLAVMVAACAWYKYRSTPGPTDRPTLVTRLRSLRES
ncbi:hypothetical protein BRC65_05515 [Halobacteriales archaeon QH_2_65_14]|nr:MAG: hypothetical protein BRC65_05515 [Halobacteriales archaeon QH_2_65_14]